MGAAFKAEVSHQPLELRRQSSPFPDDRNEASFPDVDESLNCSGSVATGSLVSAQPSRVTPAPPTINAAHLMSSRRFMRAFLGERLGGHSTRPRPPRRR